MMFIFYMMYLFLAKQYIQYFFPFQISSDVLTSTENIQEHTPKHYINSSLTSIENNKRYLAAGN